MCAIHRSVLGAPPNDGMLVEHPNIQQFLTCYGRLMRLHATPDSMTKARECMEHLRWAYPPWLNRTEEEIKSGIKSTVGRIRQLKVDLALARNALHEGLDILETIAPVAEECAACGVTAAAQGKRTRHRMCGGCMNVRYCSETCQRRDWKSAARGGGGHRDVCGLG
jgi:hypothetical protein